MWPSADTKYSYLLIYEGRLKMQDWKMADESERQKKAFQLCRKGIVICI